MGEQLFDQFSLLHTATGIIAYFFGIDIKLWFILHIIFELLENTENGIFIINKYLKFWPGGKPKSDSNINMIGDTISAIIGWYMAYYLDSLGTKLGWYNRHLSKR